MTKVFAGIDALAAAEGESFGPTDWVEIDQRQVDLFAEATGDHQWIHTDPERAASGPFGRTIAHGFLTLSLLPRLLNELYRVDDVRMGINYGLNKVRFPRRSRWAPRSASPPRSPRCAAERASWRSPPARRSRSRARRSPPA